MIQFLMLVPVLNMSRYSIRAARTESRGHSFVGDRVRGLSAAGWRGDGYRFKDVGQRCNENCGKYNGSRKCGQVPAEGGQVTVR